MKYIRILILVLVLSCNESPQKPMCDAMQPFSQFGELQVPYSGYTDLNAALECSSQTGRAVLAIYSGYYAVGDFKPVWNILLEEDVKEIIDREYIILFLSVDDPALARNNTDSIPRTVGQSNAQMQIDRYGSNAQPLYAIHDNTGKDMTEPIGYTRVENKEVFVEFLKRGLMNMDNR
jgi:hypothetical protein